MHPRDKILQRGERLPEYHAAISKKASWPEPTGKAGGIHRTCWQRSGPSKGGEQGWSEAISSGQAVQKAHGGDTGVRAPRRAQRRPGLKEPKEPAGNPPYRSRREFRCSS
jgi:hypothetical protein